MNIGLTPTSAEYADDNSTGLSKGHERMNSEGNARPLAELVRRAFDSGVSYREMERRASRAGYPMSHSQFNDYGRDVVAKPPLTPQLNAIAAGTGEPFHRVFIAMFEQYWGYVPTVLQDVDRNTSALIPMDLPPEERARLERMVAAYVESYRQGQGDGE